MRRYGYLDALTGRMGCTKGQECSTVSNESYGVRISFDLVPFEPSLPLHHRPLFGERPGHKVAEYLANHGLGREEHGPFTIEAPVQLRVFTSKVERRADVSPR